MNIVDDAMGTYLYLQGVQKQLQVSKAKSLKTAHLLTHFLFQGEYKEALEYFSLSTKMFMTALTSNPNNKKLLRTLANCLGLLNCQQKKLLQSILMTTQTNSSLVRTHLFQQAAELNQERETQQQEFHHHHQHHQQKDRPKKFWNKVQLPISASLFISHSLPISLFPLFFFLLF